MTDPAVLNSMFLERCLRSTPSAKNNRITSVISWARLLHSNAGVNVAWDSYRLLAGLLLRSLITSFHHGPALSDFHRPVLSGTYDDQQAVHLDRPSRWTRFQCRYSSARCCHLGMRTRYLQDRKISETTSSWPKTLRLSRCWLHRQ